MRLAALHRSVFLLLLSLGMSPSALAAGEPAARVENELRESEILFGAGDFDTAAKRVNELLVDEAKLAPPVRAKLFLMKARLEAAFGRKQPEVRLWLEKAHQTDGTLALDPVLDPPPLQAIWAELKKKDGGKFDKTTRLGEAPDRPSLLTALLPFGFGHVAEGRFRDGALFLSSELLFLLAANTLPGDKGEEDRDGRVHPRAREILGGFSVVGVYGYEVLDRRGDLGFLALMPFGVGQMRNGEPAKAMAFAAVEALLLTAGTIAPREKTRRMALGAAGLAWLFGAVDALTGSPPPGPDHRRSTGGVGLRPAIVAGAPGLALQARF